MCWSGHGLGSPWLTWTWAGLAICRNGLVMRWASHGVGLYMGLAGHVLRLIWAALAISWADHGLSWPWDRLV